MADNNEVSESMKRMKQLENENIRLRRLLQRAEDMSSQDADGVIKLKKEVKNLEKPDDDLGKEKIQVPRQLDEILAEETSVSSTLQQLEQKHEDHHAKAQRVEQEGIKGLLSEDDVLKRTLTESQTKQQTLQEQKKHLGSKDTISSKTEQQTLQEQKKNVGSKDTISSKTEQQTLQEQQKNVGSKDTISSTTEQRTLQEQKKNLGSKDTIYSKTEQHTLQERKTHLDSKDTIYSKDPALSQTDSTPSLTKPTASEPPTDLSSAENSKESIISSFENIKQVYKAYIEILQPTGLQENLYTLEAKNEELMNDQDNASIIQPQIKLNTAIIKSNIDILHKIEHARSKMITSIQNAAVLIKFVEKSTDVDLQISELEREMDLLDTELEESLENSTREVSELREQITDEEIRRLVNEIEIQKVVLLDNLKATKVKKELNKSSS